MKKLFFILTAASLLIATACSGVFIDPGMSDQPGGGSGFGGGGKNSSGNKDGSGGGITPTGSQTNPFPLTENKWTNGNIKQGEILYYSFNVILGTSYYVWGNDSMDGNYSKTADIRVNVEGNSGTIISLDDFWSIPGTFIANYSGTVKLKVIPYSSGSFAIAYNKTNTRPSTSQ